MPTSGCLVILSSHYQVSARGTASMFNISVRFFVIIPVGPAITGTTLAFFSFQDLLTSFLRSWCLVIFLISASFCPKSLLLTPQLAIPSSIFLCLSMISGCNALFSMFTLDGISRSCLRGTSKFSVFAFVQVPTDSLELVYHSFCRWASGLPYKLCCHCVYSCSDMSLFLCVCVWSLGVIYHSLY